MKFSDVFSQRYFLNRGRDAARRGEVEWQLLEAGIEASRFPAIDGEGVKNLRGFATGKARARAVTQQLAIRKARGAGAEVVLLLEDDVRFHPNFHHLFERLAEAGLPEDWEILFLGCEHLERPQVVKAGLVKVMAARGTHAVAIRRRAFGKVMATLRQGGAGNSGRKEDRKSPCKPLPSGRRSPAMQHFRISCGRV